MSARIRLSDAEAQIKSIYDDGSGPLEFVSTGCTILDQALGGGWVVGRVANIIGDKSTGKTLLAWEAIAQFAMAYPSGKIYYREAEEAFDKSYMASMGMPLDRVTFNDPDKPMRTVEDMMEDILNIVSKNPKEPSLYIVDSLDALSSRAEIKRQLKRKKADDDEGTSKGTYGTERAKAMSEFFRTRIGDIAEAKVTPIIISQIRDNIGVMFGRKWTRSGGHALDFYASHIVVLAHLGQIHKQVNKVKRAIGVEVRAKVEKNKVGVPFREAQFPIIFGYGIDDEQASLEWLEEAGVDVPKDINAEDLKQLVIHEWGVIEQNFAPKRRKYDL